MTQTARRPLAEGLADESSSVPAGRPPGCERLPAGTLRSVPRVQPRVRASSKRCVIAGAPLRPKSDEPDLSCW